MLCFTFVIDVGAQSGWTDTNPASIAYGTAYAFTFRGEFDSAGHCSAAAASVITSTCAVTTTIPSTTANCDSGSPYHKIWSISATFNVLNPACDLTATWVHDGTNTNSITLSGKIIVASSVILDPAFLLAAGPLTAGASYPFKREALLDGVFSSKPPPPRLRRTHFHESRAAHVSI